MNHASSIQTKAAERYMLGELLPTERDAFESHYFECPECARDIYSGRMLAEGAQAFFRDSPTEAATHVRRTANFRWTSWFRFPVAIPVAAAFALMTLTVYQNTILYPALRRGAAASLMPRVLPSAFLVPAARSAIPSIWLPLSAPFLQLTLALPPTRSLGTYDCELRDGTGRILWTMPVWLGRTTDDVNLLVPAGRLGSGTYEVVLREGGRRAIDPFRFQLGRQ